MWKLPQESRVPGRNTSTGLLQLKLVQGPSFLDIRIMFSLSTFFTFSNIYLAIESILREFKKYHVPISTPTSLDFGDVHWTH